MLRLHLIPQYGKWGLSWLVVNGRWGGGHDEQLNTLSRCEDIAVRGNTRWILCAMLIPSLRQTWRVKRVGYRKRERLPMSPFRARHILINIATRINICKLPTKPKASSLVIKLSVRWNCSSPFRLATLSCYTASFSRLWRDAEALTRICRVPPCPNTTHNEEVRLERY